MCIRDSINAEYMGMVDMSKIFRTGEDIKQHYKFDKQLGEGSFAIVRKGINKKTGQEVAIKIIDKLNLETEDSLALSNEVEILAQIDHPNIVKLIEVFDETAKFYMVMELMTGGELFDRIVDKEKYSEQEATEVIKPLIDAIAYCHSMGVAHRDLKPENLLYSSPDKGAILKISDFGLAKVLSTDLMTTACGTPGYIAPEIIKAQGYDQSVDYWSIGVILYVLLCGFPPFYEDSNEKLFEKIQTAAFDFPSPHWDSISDEAKDLIRHLLITDQSKRYTAKQIKEHQWFIKNFYNDLSHVPKVMRQWNAKQKLRRVQLMVLAATKFKFLSRKPLE
eukprot:TRINITY_DN1790_c0_g1_i9.p1 TRINITY_DN1790_c0_g1~~TRINITY_DN1790_c0_g1_i9.p1  ORF type:complete len:334 (+),score=57.65 TRINITY_DN1790_c0_g1_i9:144-1145(+)